jgi:DNA polymerase III subunit delta
MIIFLYGEDFFRSSQKLLEIKNKFLSTDKSGSGLSVFECEEEKKIDLPKKIIQTISTPNIFSSKRLVIVKNFISAFQSQEQKEILNFFKKNKERKEEDVIVVFWESNHPKKNNSLYKFLEENSRKQNFEKLIGNKMNQWALKTIQKIDPEIKISKIALEKLVAYSGSESSILFFELQKLSNYAEKKMIVEKDVDLLVRANLSNDVFQMVDSLGTKNKKRALELFHSRLEKGDDPFYLLSMFFYQFRNMLKIFDLFDRGIRSEYEIAKISKIHPFVVKKSLFQIKNFSFEKIKDIYKKLADLDSQIKIGKIDIKLGLDKFIAEL